MTRPNRARRAHRRGGAQAIVETALVIPVMLFLITGFIGLMIQVELQQELDSATKLAAESTFQAPRGSHDVNTTMPRRCRYARETFEGTASFFFNAGDGSDAVFNGPRLASPYLRFVAVNLCKVDHDCPVATARQQPPEPTYRDPGTGPAVAVGPCTEPHQKPFTDPPPPGDTVYADPDNPVSDIRCDIDGVDPSISSLRVTYCDTTVQLSFARTPLSWAVFWAPTLHAEAEALPPPFRQ